MSVVVISAKTNHILSEAFRSKLETQLQDKSTVSLNNFSEQMPDLTILLLHSTWKDEQWLIKSSEETDYIADMLQSKIRVIPVQIDDAPLLDDTVYDSIRNLKRVAGTNILTDDGVLSTEQIKDFAKQIQQLLPSKEEVVPDRKLIDTQAPDSIILPPIDWIPTALPIGIAGVIGFAVFGLLMPTSFTFDKYYWQDAADWSMFQLMLGGIAGVLIGLAAGFRWRKFLPDTKLTPFILAAAWGLGIFSLFGAIAGKGWLLIIAFLAIGVGTQAAYLIPQPVRWMKISQRTIRHAIAIFAIFVGCFALGFIGGFFALMNLVAGDAQSAMQATIKVSVIYTVTGGIGSALLTPVLLQFLRDMAVKFHPEYVEVVLQDKSEGR